MKDFIMMRDGNEFVCDAFLFNPHCHDGLIEIMEEFGWCDFPFTGENENGEKVLISVFPTKIVSRTFQTNGWHRINVYHRDRTTEEYFEK